MMTRYLSGDAPLLSLEQVKYSTLPFITGIHRDQAYAFAHNNYNSRKYLPFKLRRDINNNLIKFYIKLDFKHLIGILSTVRTEEFENACK